MFLFASLIVFLIYFANVAAGVAILKKEADREEKDGSQ